MTELNLERIAAAPEVPGSIWQGAVIPACSFYPDHEAHAPGLLMALWADERGVISKPAMFVDTEADPAEKLVEAFVEFVCSFDPPRRPAAVEVDDALFVPVLRDALAASGTVVREVPELPAIEACVDSLLANRVAKDTVLPGPLEADGVTIEGLRDFAEAAKQFDEAEPWRELSAYDLLCIESPDAPVRMAYCAVLGMDGLSFGLGFFESTEQFKDLVKIRSSSGDLWGLQLLNEQALPPSDLEAWKAHDLPRSRSGFLPVLTRVTSAGVERATGDRLAFVAGLMRALAATTSDLIDAGRWTRVATTTAGADIEYVLELDMLSEESMRRLVHPGELAWACERDTLAIQRLVSEQHFVSKSQRQAFMDDLSGKQVPEFAPRNAAEAAQDCACRAFESVGRKRRVLAREALQHSAACSDAYLALASTEPDDEAAIELLCRGVDASNDALDACESDADMFRLAVRRAVRVQSRLGRRLAAAQYYEDAVTAFQDVIAITHTDPFGDAPLLAACLLELGDDARLSRVCEQHGDDTAYWQYLEALRLFRKQGSSPRAEKLLKKGIKANPLVLSMLVGGAPSPSGDADSAQEAERCLEHIAAPLFETEGAFEWMVETVEKMTR